MEKLLFSPCITVVVLNLAVGRFVFFNTVGLRVCLQWLVDWWQQGSCTCALFELQSTGCGGVRGERRELAQTNVQRCLVSLPCGNCRQHCLLLWGNRRNQRCRGSLPLVVSPPGWGVSVWTQVSATIHEVQWYPSYFELDPSSPGEESPVGPVLYLHRPMWTPGVPHSFSEGFA